MAEDNGGILAQGLSGDVAASIRAQADAQARAAALQIQYDDMKDYQKLVDGLLTKLQESPAHHGKLADGTLPAGVLGTGFPAAEKLNKSYNTVHSELQKLSKGLAVQIEALGIAIQSAGKGYSEVDEETKRRMALLAKQAHDQYVPKRDPYAEKTAESPQPAPNTPQPNGTKKGGVLG
ncbi:hypothetical protein GCM10010215_44240 [Streptomyces virginiae]|uniref:Uncharacterized protein n=1 Tax=Streptomyces virginiae TaxID=1961 RepID=A0ABQ3NWX1_STRVG|nr:MULTISPECIES: hypothetical protein [Streptomyces]MBP2344375.1 hypothetical protein [Streptomyces virginiae]MCI4081769.1 hypothetical protein [Streptomyces sp. MMS21 TC-5]GGQ14520.1 hypothetical protein GCM10010215_44240 [Streptomyces virginiae]GHI17275.1 hypothetical protein Scinn_67380 [Streptomyces virginiae]